MERFIDEKKYMQSDFAKEFNLKFIDLKDDDFILEMQTKKEHLNGLGVLHGGLMFTLADTAAGLLCIARGKKSVTLNSNMNFIKGSKGGRIYTHTELVHAGKRTTVVEVGVYEGEDVLLAKGTFTMYGI